MKSFVDFHGELFFVIQVGWVSYILPNLLFVPSRKNEKNT